VNPRALLKTMKKEMFAQLGIRTNSVVIKSVTVLCGLTKTLRWIFTEQSVATFYNQHVLYVTEAGFANVKP
jgi:hypothetical protein